MRICCYQHSSDCLPGTSRTWRSRCYIRWYCIQHDRLPEVIRLAAWFRVVRFNSTAIDCLRDLYSSNHNRKTFATPEDPADADLTLLQNQLNTYLALEAGVRVRIYHVVDLLLAHCYESHNQTPRFSSRNSKARNSSSSSRSRECRLLMASNSESQTRLNISSAKSRR